MPRTVPGPQEAPTEYSLSDKEDVYMCKYVHKGTFIDSSDKSLYAYFIPDIPIDPGNTAAGKKPHTVQVHSGYGQQRGHAVQLYTGQIGNELQKAVGLCRSENQGGLPRGGVVTF